MRLWEQFDRMIVFDTETTGIEFERDRIIEIGAVALEDGAETGGLDLFLRLPPGRRLDPFITNLTGITEERLEAEGVGDEEAAERDDLERYVDLFGTHPKYGLSGRRIASVTYRPQPYDRRRPLYERT